MFDRVRRETGTELLNPLQMNLVWLQLLSDRSRTMGSSGYGKMPSGEGLG